MTQLRELREAAGVPRIILADRAGVSRFRLYEAERGVRELTPAERAAIDKALAEALEPRISAALELRQRMAVNA